LDSIERTSRRLNELFLELDIIIQRVNEAQSIANKKLLEAQEMQMFIELENRKAQAIREEYQAIEESIK